MTRTFQTSETTALILTFPHDYPGSRTAAEQEEREQEARWAADAEYEHQLDEHIRRNYGDCGAPISGTWEGYIEDNTERMIEQYGVGPAYAY